jgi:mannose-6-phosphate isomerase
LKKTKGNLRMKQPNNPTLYPITFKPVLKSAIWGGHNLEKFGRTIPAEGIAESWEIAAHPNGSSIVDNGIHAGKNLAELTNEMGAALIGTNAAWALARGKFPLLVKLLDANRSLSVQVHPKDPYALAHEGHELGKTEMWVVLDAKPGAQIILGVKHGTTPDKFRAGIEQGHLEPYLHYLDVKPGDHVCVPSGSLHAILDGIVIAEIQQNSDTTYRVYDWNRVDSNGKARELHIDKAMDVINFEQVEPSLPTAQIHQRQPGLQAAVLCKNEYFFTERIYTEAGSKITGVCDGSSLEIWGVMDGSVNINGLDLSAVSFCLLPAALGSYDLVANTQTTLLRTTIPIL